MQVIKCLKKCTEQLSHKVQLLQHNTAQQIRSLTLKLGCGWLDFTQEQPKISRKLDLTRAAILEG